MSQREILNDGKLELDRYYAEKDFDYDLFLVDEKKFFSLLKKTFIYYNLLKDSLAATITKPVIVYIIFYLAINNKLDLMNQSELRLEQLRLTFDDLADESKAFDYTFTKEMKNQNQKSRRENMINDFEKSLEANSQN